MSDLLTGATGRGILRAISPGTALRDGLERILRGRTGLSLAATGGVHTADDALKMLLAGADVVHMASAVLQRGPQVLKEVLEGIERWMEAREYDSVAQMKGSMSQQNLPNPSAFARAAYLHALDSFTPPPGVRY